jgi:type I restriction enzyme S subunit
MMNQWKEMTWGDLATLEYGKALRGYRNSSGRFRVYGTNGPIGWHDQALFDKPSVIIGRKGAYRGVYYAAEPFFVIDTAFYLKPNTEFDMRWAYYELLTHDINSMDSGSAIPSTSRDSFYRLPVCVPPLEVQHAIAQILGALDDKIKLNRQMNETLEAIARALFKSWFVDFDPVRAKAEGRDPGLPKRIADLFPDSFEDSELGEIPKGWGISTVGEEFNLTMGQSPPGETYNEIGEGLSFFQGRADFGFRYPSHRVFCTAPTRFADPGDALVSVRAPVGDINMALERCAVGRGVAAIRHKSGSRSYTYYAMLSLVDVFGDFEAEGTVFGCINKDDFHRIKFIAPPPQLVLAFEKAAFPIDQAIENHIMQSRTLAALRDALLPKLIPGDLRVKDVNKFVEGTTRC